MRSCLLVRSLLYGRGGTVMLGEAYEPEITNLLRLCDMHNIPMATNLATAEVLIHGLDRGDLDWRDIVNPK